MGVRITQSMLLRTAMGNLTRQRSRLARAQEQASSGLRINRPSDDPVGVRLATRLRASQAATDQFLRNIGQSESRLRVMESALGESTEVLRRARELAIQGANDTLDAEARRALAAEVAALHDNLLAQSNTRFTGGHVFGGYASTAPAFSVSGSFVSGGAPPTVSFDGDSNEIEIDVEPGMRVPTTLDGRRVFLGDGDGDGATDAGRENLFDVLESLWQALDSDDPVAVRASLGRLDRAQTQINVERTRVGAVDTRVQSARARLSDAQVELSRRLSDAQDADTAEVLSDLVSQEAALRASLEASARVIQPSLLDFVR